jgi:nucleoside-diphosphate-sugar epimerase/GNAT superfamily N-acetyltransferase
VEPARLIAIIGEENRSMRIDLASPADVPRLLEIRTAAFADQAPAAYTPEQVRTLLDDVDPDELRAMIAAGQLYVAIVDGRIAGLAGWWQGQVRHVYVDPAYVRRGVGTRLLRRVEEHFHGTIPAGVSLHAEGFYAANGYRVVRRATAWDGSGYLEMAKTVPGPELGRVLVTGAAGLIGRAVLDRLAAEGIAATALILDGDAPADRVLRGDAQDPDLVATALDGADAVIHLAAIPAPDRDPDDDLFAGNTRATFTVLDQAGRAGLRRVALASSYAICGLPFARRPLRMPYLPIDTGLPLQITDPYALSKQTDEATAAMMARQYGMTVTALRLPFVGDHERLARAAAAYARDPAAGAAEVWSYLDARDAARALLAALTPATPGYHTLYVAAPETIAPFPTEDLVTTYHPGVPHPPFPGRTVPIDLAPARGLIGFDAVFPWPVR